MNFNIEHDLLPTQHIPQDDKTPEGLAFTKMLLHPFKRLYSQFMAYKNEINYKLKFSAQVIYLEHLLNEQFNNGLPAYTNGVPTGIYISKPLSYQKPPVLRNKIEQRPRLVIWKKSDPSFNPNLHSKLVLRMKSEYQSQIKFIINVPIACFDVNNDTNKLIKLKAWVNFYNDIANYSIVNY
jgi:hypothetical protein